MKAAAYFFEFSLKRLCSGTAALQAPALLHFLLSLIYSARSLIVLIDSESFIIEYCMYQSDNDSESQIQTHSKTQYVCMHGSDSLST